MAPLSSVAHQQQRPHHSSLSSSCLFISDKSAAAGQVPPPASSACLLLYEAAPGLPKATGDKFYYKTPTPTPSRIQNFRRLGVRIVIWLRAIMLGFPLPR